MKSMKARSNYTKKKKKKKQINNGLRCPYCGKPAILIPAAEILPKGSRITQLYACSDYPECDAYVSVHPGTDRPMGTLANQNLRLLRLTAHRHFDRIHKLGYMSTDRAYEWLAVKLYVPRRKAHIGMLNEYECELVIKESKKYLEEQMQRLPGNYFSNMKRHA